MITTKISLTSDQAFETEIQITEYFFGDTFGINQPVLEHARKVLANNWILNQHNYKLVNSNTLEVYNYSDTAENAQLFANSVSEWTALLPSTVTVAVEQSTIAEIPTNATPILVDGAFYLDDNVLDLK